MSTDSRMAGEKRISLAVRYWLLAVISSFVLGYIFLRLLAQFSSTTWSVGILINLGLAVAVGVVLGWTHQGIQVLIGVLIGSVVTILGLDLVLLAPTPTETAQLGLGGLVIFDTVALLVALIGMSILVGGAALLGLASESLVRHSGCLRRLRNVRERTRLDLHRNANQTGRSLSSIWSAG